MIPAVSSDGEIYGASRDDNIYHFDVSGQVLNSLPGGCYDPMDIDIADNGKPVVSGRFGDVLFLDESLTILTVFNADMSNAFVAF